MTSVLVLGASGYIGTSVSSAFARAGYKVYGLIRNPDKAAALQSNEIVSVIGDGYKPETYKSTLAKVSMVVDTMSPNRDNPIEGAKVILDAVRDAAKRIERHNGAVTYIQTSGTWVYGDNKTTIVAEDSPQHPLGIVSTRPQIESMVHSLGREVCNIRTVVVRPTYVYGRAGGLTGAIFDGVSRGCLKFPGDLSNRYQTVHIDDLAEFYVRVADRAMALDGMSFNVTNRHSESVRDIVDAAFRAAGKSGKVEVYTPVDLMDKGIASTQIIDGRVARRLTGWEPRKLSLVDGMALYYYTWRACKSVE